MLGELQSVGLLHQVSALDARCASALLHDGARVSGDVAPAVYVGMDPTAPSLHVGNLLQLCTLLRFRRRGFRTVALLGGATGLIGDPSGRTSERALVDDTSVVERNARAIAASVQRIVGNDDGDNGGGGALRDTVLVNNADWLGPQSMSALQLLRDVGKHFSVTAMLARDSVRARLDAGHGLSYTEFSYQLLQSYDFYVLHRDFDVGLQIGGSDQWGNITAGIDYVRRRQARAADAAAAGDDHNVVSGLTVPLLLAADGTKLGKSAGNATVWLDPALTTPFEFFQYFVQLSDADAAALLPKLTLMSVEQVGAVLVEHDADRSQRRAQLALARSVCSLVHGAATAAGVEQATQILFGDERLSDVNVPALAAVLSSLPHATITRPEFFAKPIVALLADSEACASKTAARKLVLGGGCYVGGRRVTDVNYVPRETDLVGEFCILRTGKKSFRVVRAVEHKA
jgi:tyrosyl-tRNA synthetase